MLFKSFQSLLSVFCLTCLLSGCGGESSAPAPSQPTNPAPSPEPTAIARLFLVAHPDDIELFMGAKMMQGVQQTTGQTERIIFVVTSAGDAGQGRDIPQGHRLPYWKARDLSHQQAIRYLHPLQLTAKTHEVTLGQYRFERESFGENIVTYNLRVPDSGASGQGYMHTGRVSLTRLYHNQLSHLTTLDGQVFSKAQWLAVLQHLIEFETAKAAALEINLTEDDADLNPKDHAEHQANSQLILAALDTWDQSTPRCYQLNKFATYANSKKPKNLSPTQQYVHEMMWQEVDRVLVAEKYPTVLDWHRMWLGKQYITTQQQRGRCQGSGVQIGVTDHPPALFE